MISVVCWRWGALFDVGYVNRLRASVARCLDLPHQFTCVTDDAAGLAPGIRVVRPPSEFAGTLRCRRRMWQFAAERRDDLGDRILAIDLDVVLVGNITTLVDRPEPIVGWRVGYAGVVSGSFLLFDAGALDGAWRAYRDDPEGYPARTGERLASDQAMLNYWLRTGRPRKARPVAMWTEADGFVTWFGEGYGRLEHLGMGPGRPDLPPGARVVVLGSADKALLDEGRYPWVREHWR